jgi:hypothetical protein
LACLKERFARLAFGSIAQGANADLTVQVFNVGTTNLVINDFSDLTGPGDFQVIAPPPFPLTVAPSTEVDFTVRFTPTKGGNQHAIFLGQSGGPLELVAGEHYRSDTANAEVRKDASLAYKITRICLVPLYDRRKSKPEDSPTFRVRF